MVSPVSATRRACPGRRLEASAYVLYTGTAHAEIVEQAVNRAAVAMSDLYFEPWRPAKWCCPPMNASWAASS
jgi:cell division ATPase FtsA